VRTDLPMLEAPHATRDGTPTDSSERLAILFVCHRFPFPPHGGAKVRAFHMIRHLAQRHTVTVASLVRSREEAAEGAGIAPYCARYEMARVHAPAQVLRMLACLPTPRPSSLAYFSSVALARRIDALVARERFDLVVAHSSSMAQYVEHVGGVPKIMDFCDMDAQKWLEYARYKPFPLSLGYALEGSKLVREEGRIARSFDVCTLATRAEQATLDGYGTGAVTGWFPNGVDTEYFTPSSEAHDPDLIVFVGRMDYYPNEECMVAFCADVLPRLRAHRPGTKLAIVGADPPATVRALGKLAGVAVTGSVSDVRPYLRRAALMVAPLNIARGTQNKILEGMASGVPVVASRVAADGVDARDDEHFLVATTLEGQVAAILRVLDDSAERARLAQAGRARVLSHHTWPMAMRRFDAIVERCLARAAALKAPAWRRK
jgi:sugar transferase (PEP-CTERM/EpsH1 system associated)